MNREIHSSPGFSSRDEPPVCASEKSSLEATLHVPHDGPFTDPHDLCVHFPGFTSGCPKASGKTVRNRSQTNFALEACVLDKGLLECSSLPLLVKTRTEHARFFALRNGFILTR